MAAFSHILVKYEYEAQDILKLLAQGKDFAELARRFSSCPSAKEGGFLGEMKRGRMDEDFEEAAYALKPGQTTSKAVKTRFGYHIILRKS